MYLRFHDNDTAASVTEIEDHRAVQVILGHDYRHIRQEARVAIGMCNNNWTERLTASADQSCIIYAAQKNKK